MPKIRTRRSTGGCAGQTIIHSSHNRQSKLVRQAILLVLILKDRWARKTRKMTRHVAFPPPRHHVRRVESVAEFIAITHILSVHSSEILYFRMLYLSSHKQTSIVQSFSASIKSPSTTMQHRRIPSAEPPSLERNSPLTEAR